jgi:N-acetyl sugar amidotransferase
MRYCTRCLYPETSAVPLTFDEKGVCSGCRIHEERNKIDWKMRWKELERILEKYRCKDGSNYDCIIPVSGGKDSHFQTHIIKNVFKLNPLLVTFNHEWNTEAGIRNLTNLITKFGCDHIRFTPNPKIIPKLARKALKTQGDPCWHCHAGIYTYPVRIAVKFKIPLIVWGEQGFMDLGGMYSHHDMVEMTKKFRKEHGMRGYDAEDMVDEEEGITLEDLKWAIYPSDKEIEEVGVRGIYLGNYIPWDYKTQTELMIKLYGFETTKQPRTYTYYENVECWHDNGMHDYLKWLKFGYGRATDHASKDIRFGRMTREEGIKMVEKYDAQRPPDLDLFLDFVGMTEEEFIKSIDHLRDPRAWKKDKNGKWVLRDHVRNHKNDPYVDEVRLPIKGDHKYILTPPKPKKKCGYVLM